MPFLTTIQRSLGELYRATDGVLRDAWKANKGQLLLLFGLSALIGFVPYVSNWVIALIINALVTTAKTHVVSSAVLTLVFIGALTYLVRDSLMALSSHYAKIAWIDRRQRYELALSEKLVSLDVATHENPSFKDEIQVLQEQGASYPVASFVDSLIRNAQNLVGVITASAIVLAIDWRYFVLILGASVPQLYTELRYGRGMWSIYQSQSGDRRLYEELRRRTNSAESIRQLQTFQTTPYFMQRQREVLSRFLAAQKGEERRRFGLILLSQLLLAAAILVVLLMLIHQVAAGTLLIGTFSFIFGTTIGLEGTVTAFLMAIADQRSDARAVASFYSIMEREPYVKRDTSTRRLVLRQAPRIEFRNVTFAYPMKPDENVLEDFSLTVESGERLALVGINGAGKSTLIKLLCRFYDPTKGAVLIDGINLREICLDDWYHNLALLAQEFDTYQFKAWEGISLGRLNGGRNQQKVECAARRAQADSFIERWKDRYDQQIGVEFDGGIDPSGGQRQKLALARTLYRDAFVTILDEPTAHVDADSEQRIFEQLEATLDKKQSLILISHRFSTVRTADRICVVGNGRVAELGSHEELVARQGIYAHLFEQQAKGYR